MKTAKSVDVNWLSFARIQNFNELLGQHFRGNILQKKRQNKKYSLPGLRGLGPCNLSLESDVLPFLRSDSSGRRPPNQFDVNGLSFARIQNFSELVGQRFSGNIVQKKRQNKKYSLPGLMGLGSCNLSLESDVLPWF